MKIILCTIIALFTMAGNSILCRLALGDGAIDAASFTAIRLLTGVVVLGAILMLTHKPGVSVSKGSWKAAFALFFYAITFSYAYISLDTGVGALILFGTVQITMILVGIYYGSRLHIVEWLGMAISFLGFVYLVLPDLSSPSLLDFVLMVVAGVGWGSYTLAGRQSTNPMQDTAYNFIRSLPLVIILLMLTVHRASLTTEGVLLAVFSGGVTSALGYIIWYTALGGLSAIQAAVIQLLVPVIATLGGVVFVGEALTTRLVLSAVIILGGILMVTLAKHYYRQGHR